MGGGENKRGKKVIIKARPGAVNKKITRYKTIEKKKIGGGKKEKRIRENDDSFLFIGVRTVPFLWPFLDEDR